MKRIVAECLKAGVEEDTQTLKVLNFDDVVKDRGVVDCHTTWKPWKNGTRPSKINPVPPRAIQVDSSDFRIVIAFQDTEAFAPSLISDFIHRNLAPLSRLPVTFLFGVSSTLDQFQHSLPTPLIQALDFKLFQLRQNDDCLRLIVDRVLLDAGPRLRLGPRVLTLLIDRYKSWNQSVEESISGIKVRPPFTGTLQG